MAAAACRPGRRPYRGWPKCTGNGLFKAGGGWHTLTARVDNTNKKALKQFQWEPSQVVAEVYAKNADGSWAWQPVKTWNDGETLLGIGLGSRPVAAGEVYWGPSSASASPPAPRRGTSPCREVA
ncbi:hypothetical protein, partial [Streptomyces katrae]|uniref:hypothetical protein n=1 Tax=Streptomyces katrae TaxID=68223 RepID=UPI000B227E67